MHCVDLGESFPTSIYLHNLASIQPRTSPNKFEWFGPSPVEPESTKVDVEAHSVTSTDDGAAASVRADLRRLQEAAAPLAAF